MEQEAEAEAEGRLLCLAATLGLGKDVRRTRGERGGALGGPLCEQSLLVRLHHHCAHAQQKRGKTAEKKEGAAVFELEFEMGVRPPSLISFLLRIRPSLPFSLRRVRPPPL